ncbi:MAG: leucine-rich repeat domain-containing protein, partial [Candidatus Thorarchaeota archaeon]
MGMVSIVRYSTRAGPDNQLIHRISHNNIKLKSHGATFVDLSGITNMENLQRVDIANNRLEELDLSPLSECKELRYLDISENKIREIDLSPLEACKHLERLD